MSRYIAFRRQPVDQQVAQHLRTVTFPAPTRGIIQNENQAFMQPGGANVQDNWASTMRGVKLRGGCIRWCDLHAADAPVPPVPDDLRKPVVSAFEYVTASQERMYAANVDTLYDVTAGFPSIVKAGRTNGNYVAAQFANADGEWMLACNEVGDFVLRFDGTSWLTLDPSAGTPTDGASAITGPVDSAVEHGLGLGYVWKYRNRLFFIETDSMNAWYLGVDSVGGLLQQIPLAGAATRGGKLLFGAVWSLDAGDGTDDKCVFVTNLGEVLIFSGTNPAEATAWRQEGRYTLSAPLGMNAHLTIGGDLIIMTVDGIVPLSQAITKEAGQLELAMLTRTIKPLWRDLVTTRRALPWSVHKWDEFGAVFVAAPGGGPGDRFCLCANNATAAWSRFVGWDATCFIQNGSNLFFGTQDGIIMQSDRTGYDDGNHAKIPYTAVVVGGWETFGAQASQIVWHQARAVFIASAGQPFNPQLSASQDYIVTLPAPPSAGFDPGSGLDDRWDVGKWGDAGSSGHVPTQAESAAFAQWDGLLPVLAVTRSTLWVSIGATGYAHAPVIQFTVAQEAAPRIELIAISATYEPAGVNVD
jgi:hypothetical protein